MIALILVATLVLLLAGMVIAYAFGVASFLGFASLDQPVEAVPGIMFGGINTFAMMAVPFFILAGLLLQRSGIADRLIDLVGEFTRRLRGGLGATLVLTSALFGACSGSSVATVSTMGSAMSHRLKAAKYDAGYVGALTSVSGTLGILIPPSIPMVIFGLSTGVSIGALFTAGIAVAVVLIVLLLVVHLVWSQTMTDLDEAALLNVTPGPRWSVLPRRFGAAVPALFVPIIVLGGIYGGIFTPTEAGAVGCVVAVALGFFVYGGLTTRSIGPIFRDAALTTASLMVIMAMGSAFSRYLTLSGISVDLANWVTEHAGNAAVFMLLVNIAVTAVALFVEENTTIIIMAPLLTPIATSYGIDPVHFGVVMVTIISISLWTPPVAPNLFVASRVCGVSIVRMMRPVFLYIALVGVPMLVVVNVFPDLILFLGN